jgi:hypothetical protein
MDKISACLLCCLCNYITMVIISRQLLHSVITNMSGRAGCDVVSCTRRHRSFRTTRIWQISFFLQFGTELFTDSLCHLLAAVRLISFARTQSLTNRKTAASWSNAGPSHIYIVNIFIFITVDSCVVFHTGQELRSECHRPPIVVRH